jgi:hypothetical protein
MRGKFAVLVFAAFSASALVAQAQTPAAASAPTDVYHVMFVKAAPGQAAALAKQLQEQDPKIRWRRTTSCCGIRKALTGTTA